jgi:hypothetical protein
VRGITPRGAVLLAATICAAAAACSSGPRTVLDQSGPPSAGPPPVRILVHSADRDGGDIFIAPMGGNYAAGPEILTDTGKVVWFHALPQGQGATDFRTQTYLGQPVLTWYQDGSGGGGTDYIYNDHYHQIATVTAAHGYSTDFHEFLITPWNTALILAYDRTTANLTSIGGPPDQSVVDGVVQEIDIKTGQVLFQWNSAGHVPYTDSHVPRPSNAGELWDWIHINAVHLDTDGNLLIDARNTWTTYKVNLHTGAIMWELGGKQSSFKLEAAPGQSLDADGEIFSWQHDPEALGGGLYTWFDDESPGQPGGTSLLGHSRAVTVRLDLATHVATLIKSDNQPEGQVAPVEGNAQTMPDGNLFVGWGALPYISEFSPSGTLLFNAQFPPGVSTYRAYRLPWPPAA